VAGGVIVFPLLCFIPVVADFQDPDPVGIVLDVQRAILASGRDDRQLIACAFSGHQTDIMDPRSVAEASKHDMVGCEPDHKACARFDRYQIPSEGSLSKMGYARCDRGTVPAGSND